MKQSTIHFFLVVFFLLLGNVTRAQEATSQNDAAITLTADNMASKDAMKTAINEAISKLTSDQQSKVNLVFTLDECITVDNVQFNNIREAIKEITNVKGIDYSGITSSSMTLPSKALRGLSNVTTIKLPKLTSLSNNLFTDCGNLANLTIGDWSNTEDNKGLSMATIPTGCFQGCNSLKNLKFTGVKKIEGWAFSNCKALTAFPVELATNATNVEIGSNAFEGLGLSEIIVPDGITSIGDNCFANCENLTSITFPSTLASLKPSFDLGCEKLSNITFAEGNTKYVSNGDFVYEINGNELTLTKVLYSKTNVTIPSAVDGKNVTAIGASAFQNSQVASVTFEDNSNIKTIGGWAFSGCKSLASIELPNSVTTIGNNAFEVCKALTTVTLNEGLKKIGNGTFDNCNNAGFTTLNIPSTVDNIAPDFVNNCSNIKTLTVAEGNLYFMAKDGIMYSNRIRNNDGVNFQEGIYNIFRVPEAYELSTTTTEDIYTENGEETKTLKILDMTADNQANITINGAKGSITYVGSNAFANCKNIQVLKVPNTVTNLQDECCKNSAINVFYIPEDLTEAGYGSGTPFSLCNNLTAFAGDNEKLKNFYVDDRGILYNRNKDDFRLYKVPNNYYTTTDGIFTVRYYVKSIQTCAFEGVQNLNTVILAQGIKELPLRCFYYAGANLTKVLIPNSVTKIGKDVFANSNIQYVTMLTTTETTPGNGNENPYNCFWQWNNGTIHLSQGYNEFHKTWASSSETQGNIEKPDTQDGDSKIYGWYQLNKNNRLVQDIRHRALFESETITGFDNSIRNSGDVKDGGTNNTLDGGHYDYITLYRSFTSLKKANESDPDKYGSLALPVDVTKATLVNAFGANTKVWEFTGRTNNYINFQEVKLSEKEDNAIIIKKGVAVLISPEYKEDSYLLQMNLGSSTNNAQMVMAANAINADATSNSVAIGSDNATTSYGASYIDKENDIKTTTNNWYYDESGTKHTGIEFIHGFYGTYQAHAIMEQGSYYMTAAGGFNFATAKNKQIAKAFRGFIHGNEENNYATPASSKISIDGFTTSIADAHIEGFEPQSGNIYNINGQLVRKNATSTDGLSKGIYIMNGKKVIVK